MKGVAEYRDFFAICDHEPPAEPAIRAGGTIVFNESGWSAELVRTKGDTGINPYLLHLDLVFTPPDEGSAQTDPLEPFELREWREAPPVREYQQVEFHVRGSDDQPPPILEVDHPQ